MTKPLEHANPARPRHLPTHHHEQSLLLLVIRLLSYRDQRLAYKCLAHLDLPFPQSKHIQPRNPHTASVPTHELTPDAQLDTPCPTTPKTAGDEEGDTSFAASDHEWRPSPIQRQVPARILPSENEIRKMTVPFLRNCALEFEVPFVWTDKKAVLLGKVLDGVERLRDMEGGKHEVPEGAMMDEDTQERQKGMKPRHNEMKSKQISLPENKVNRKKAKRAAPVEDEEWEEVMGAALHIPKREDEAEAEHAELTGPDDEMEENMEHWNYIDHGKKEAALRGW
ncbi:hypothetical protein FN846DRAFT_1013115 [Sphaerosporella brunnea]|uniref:Uncharacterized protein n=1 Tax=Sphaerosporella brunnea TaxID=1250544 RepID=A0A5J5EZ46_9PEZI|nr:hypothetical protein FN846DRAFT_1013115 [Sphaerosporella brunnea]